jgi:hypothetical protein
MDTVDPLDRDKSSGDKSERTDQGIVDVMDIERDFSESEVLFLCFILYETYSSEASSQSNLSTFSK